MDFLWGGLRGGWGLVAGVGYSRLDESESSEEVLMILHHLRSGHDREDLDF